MHNQNEILISIIIPVYNVEKYLRQCLDSLTEKIPSQVEIIAINDGSTDNSAQILDEYKKKFKCIKVIHKKNEGIRITRNLGLEHAKGKYIGFVDSDDYVKPEMYEKLLQKALETDADIISCSFYRYYEQTDSMFPEENSSQIRALKKSNGKIESAEELFLEEAFVWNRLYKRSIIEKYNIRFVNEVQIADDTLFHRTFLLHSKTMATIPDCLYIYRLGRAGQNTNSKDEKIFSFFINCNILYEIIKQQNLQNFVPWFNHFIISFLCYGYNLIDYKLRDEYFEKFCDAVEYYGITQNSKIAFPKHIGSILFQIRYLLLRILHPLTIKALVNRDKLLFNTIVDYRKFLANCTNFIKNKIFGK